MNKKIYCCPIKPLYAAIFSLNPAEIRMISSNFKFQAPPRIMTTLLVFFYLGNQSTPVFMWLFKETLYRDITHK